METGNKVSRKGSATTLSRWDGRIDYIAHITLLPWESSHNNYVNRFIFVKVMMKHQVFYVFWFTVYNAHHVRHAVGRDRMRDQRLVPKWMTWPRKVKSRPNT